MRMEAAPTRVWDEPRLGVGRLRRSLRTAFSIGVLLASAVAGSGAASAGAEETAQEAPGASVPDWQNLPYLRHSNGWFRILSNHETFSGVQITSNNPITPNNPDPTSEEYKGIGLEVLWAKRCVAVAEQTMKVSRKLYFPGAPDTLQISQWAYSSAGRHPLKSIAVKVNGLVVHQVRGPDIQTAENRTFIELPRGAGDSFRYGENTVTFVATKRETKRSAGYCNTKKFGAAFELAGTFRADVSSTIPHGSATAHAAYMPMTITNNGPSHLPAGTHPCQVPTSGGQTQPGSCGYPTMALWALSETATVTGLVGLDGSSATDSTVRPDCTTFPYQAGAREGYILNCGLPALAPGESVTIGVGLTYDDVTPSSIIYFGYGAPGFAETIESNANNGEDDRQVTANQT